MSDGLVAGGAVRIRRNAADLVAQVNTPADGSQLGTRGLLAGDYLASDEADNHFGFRVENEGDLAVIPVQCASNAVTVVGLGGDVVDRIAERKPPRKPSAARGPTGG